MAAISPQGNIQMLGSITSDTDVEALASELRGSGNVLAIADTEDELRSMARRIELGAKEEERRAKRRAMQKASRKANR